MLYYYKIERVGAEKEGKGYWNIGVTLYLYCVITVDCYLLLFVVMGRICICDACVCDQVIHGSDPNAWHRGPDGSILSLLHRAILLRDTPTSCFLIRSGADVNSCTRPTGEVASDTPTGTNGKANGEILKEFAPPLHMACERGLKSVVQCLVEHHANVNAKVQ